MYLDIHFVSVFFVLSESSHASMHPAINSSIHPFVTHCLTTAVLLVVFYGPLIWAFMVM